MLKIFNDDIDTDRFAEIKERVKNDIIQKIELQPKIKDFIKIVDSRNIESIVEGILCDIDSSNRLRDYHELYKDILELRRFNKLSESSKQTRQNYIKVLQEILNFFHKIEKSSLYQEIASKYLTGYTNEYNCLLVEEISTLIGECDRTKRIPLQEKTVAFDFLTITLQTLNPIVDFIDEVNKIFSYSVNISSRRADLARCIKLETCPYCNLEILNLYEINLGGEEKKLTSTCELDHVNPQSDYPLFESSFWNLIPVCHTCNSKKLQQLIHFNSWSIDLNNDISRIRVRFNDNQDLLKAYIDLKEKFKERIGVEITGRTLDIQEDIQLLELQERYNSNSEIKVRVNHVMNGLKNIREKSVKSLLELTHSSNNSALFQHYFELSPEDFHRKHYSSVRYGKLIAELLDDINPDFEMLGI